MPVCRGPASNCRTGVGAGASGAGWRCWGRGSHGGCWARGGGGRSFTGGLNWRHRRRRRWGRRWRRGHGRSGGFDCVGAATWIDDGAAAAADNRIVTAAADQSVLPGAGGDRVVAKGAGKKVIAVAG